MFKTRLEAKVDVVNRVHRIANELQPKLLEFFAPYVGEKVRKKDGTLLKKIADKVREIEPDDDSITFFANCSSDYTLSFTVKSSSSFKENSVSITQYHEVYVYVGDCTTETGILTKLYDLDVRPTNYTVEGIKTIREQYEAANKQARDLKSKLANFGEHDAY